MKLPFFRKRAITPAEAAKVLSAHARNGQSDRELMRATTRQMREQLGMPPHPALNPR